MKWITKFKCGPGIQYELLNILNTQMDAKYMNTLLLWLIIINIYGLFSFLELSQMDAHLSRLGMLSLNHWILGQ
uniref:Uncharacterized protein n=1 Tax=Lepeophtheirus salmonis TaxID=72036 RepID=A0A0K2U0W0_LEPSM